MQNQSAVYFQGALAHLTFYVGCPIKMYIFPKLNLCCWCKRNADYNIIACVSQPKQETPFKSIGFQLLIHPVHLGVIQCWYSYKFKQRL